MKILSNNNSFVVFSILLLYILKYDKITKGGDIVEVITIANHKGGAGKTTTALNLFHGLKKKGFRVLGIDLDSQCNFTFSTGSEGNKPSSAEVILNPQDIEQAIKNDFISGAEELSNLSAILMNQAKNILRLDEALQRIKSKYDFVVIDTAPNTDLLTLNSFVASHSIIIPCLLDSYSIKGIANLKKKLDEISGILKKAGMKPKAKIEGILLVKYDRRKGLHNVLKDNIEMIAEAYGTKVFKTAIRDNVKISEAQAFKESLFDYAPNSNGAKDYEEFINEFLNERK